MAMHYSQNSGKNNPETTVTTLLEKAYGLFSQEEMGKQISHSQKCALWSLDEQLRSTVILGRDISKINCFVGLLGNKIQ